jgi:hypothetical protein
VLPIWSATADPRVVVARALLPGGGGGRLFDMIREAGRVVRSCSGEHLLIDRGGVPFRFDVMEGSVLAGPVTLHFDLPDDLRLDDRLSVIRAFAAGKTITRHHLQLCSRLHALQAVDARGAGASLREIADCLLGCGDWPGDGEHRKSFVRRMIATGERMVCAGPCAVLVRGSGRRKL